MALNQTHVENIAKENFCPESVGLELLCVKQFALFTANLPECKYCQLTGAVEQQTALKAGFQWETLSIQWLYFCQAEFSNLAFFIALTKINLDKLKRLP